MPRAQRLLELLELLRMRRRTTVGELADDLGTSTRTVQRDLAALNEAGIPVVTERGRYGGVHLLPGDQVDLSRLTSSEADVLRVTDFDVDRAKQLGAEVASRKAVGKVTVSRRPAPRVHDLPLSLSQVVSIDHRGWFAVPEQPFDVAALAAELRRGRALALDYRRSGAAHSEHREVEPYGLLLRGDRWYLVARAGDADRLFSLTRLNDWQPLQRARALPAGRTLTQAADALVERLESPGSVTVVALMDGDRLDLARRILGSRLVEVQAEGDDRARITVTYDQVEGVRQLLQFAGHLVVLSPPRARDLIARASALALAAHTDP